MWKIITLEYYVDIIMLRTFNFQLKRYFGIEKEHTLWDLMLILIPEEQMDHIQYLTMELGNKGWKSIIKYRHFLI